MPWESYDFDGSEFTEKLDESKLPCRLFRGKESLLAKIMKSDGADEDTKENIRQEVRAICSNWLRMQNVCVLIGAGASKHILGFVGKDIYKKIKEILATRDSIKILEKIEQKASGNGDEIGANFEDFLSQLTMVKRFLMKEKPLDKIEFGIKDVTLEEINLLLKDLERAIIVIFNKVFEEREEPVPHEALLSKLVARDPQQGRAKIFTTNYDTLIEQAMDSLAIIYSDGFSGTVLRRFNPASYELDYYYPGEVTTGRIKRYDKVLHLYKLHGSINWRTSNISRARDPYGIYIETSPIPKEEEIKTNSKLLDDIIKDNSQCLSILPMASKYGETLTMPYAHLFRSMFASLKEPQTICFIFGYRGWDKHVNRIIEDSLTNPSFNCVIVDPYLSDWTKSLIKCDRCERIYVFSGEWARFEEFAIHVLPHVEILDTDLKIAKTMKDLQGLRE